ncbi:MAG: AAA family ATPase [Nanoarchaeota archaeon]
MEAIKLKVQEAMQDDVNKGIVRIDSSFMRALDIRPGNIVEIKGGRTTVAIADRSLPGDIGLNIIRMDGLIRRNAKTSISEMVDVKKPESVKEAKKVTISPARKGVMIRANPVFFKQGLLGRAVVKGDIVSLGGTRRRRTAMLDDPFFPDVFSMIDETMMGFGFGDFKFIVVDTLPKTPVLITENTEVIFNPEAVELKEEKTIDISYEDVGGLEDEIKKVREMVELPLKHPEIFERLGIEAPKGVLLHGPPGTGKTLLAKAVANETNSNFFVINGPEIMSKFYGQSEENLRKKFEEAEKSAPSIIFIDEIDAIASKREESKGEVERRVVAQLLANMDGLKSRGKVVVIAATNIPNSLDPALRRPGRFDREIEIGVPGKEGRLNILKIHTRNMPKHGTYYDDIAEIELKYKRDIIEKRADGEIKALEKQINEHKREIERLKTEVKEEEKKIQEQETEKSKADESTIRRIIMLIKQFNQKIQANKSEIETKKNQINALEKEIEPPTSHKKRLNEIKERFKEKSHFNNLIKNLRELERQKDIWGHEDPRVHFLNITQDKLLKDHNTMSEKLRDSIAELIDLKILDEGFYTEVRMKGIERDLNKIAEITHGFVGADLAALAREAAMLVLRKVLPDINLKENEDQEISKEILERLVVSIEDLREALKVVRPSALREVLIEIPNIRWTDIGGLDYVKQQLKEAVEWPLHSPEVFTRLGVKPPKGILLYGAPGTGKTLLAKAVARETEANFISVKGPELLSKWVGESERAVREIFKKARQASPTIVFFDEIDSIAPRRSATNDNHVTERVVNQLLTEMDGLQILADIVIIAATNRPDILDTALLRPGRFDRIILTPVPDLETRKGIFKIHLKNVPIEDGDTTDKGKKKKKKSEEEPENGKGKDALIEDLAKKTEGYVGADIEAVCREAAIIALRDSNLKATRVNASHFDKALEVVRPSASKDIQKAYADLEGQFRTASAKQMEAEKPSYYG